MELSEKKTLRKKEQILASAIEVIEQKGYSATTMEDIAAELLMTKGSLYYYFKNKGDLMAQCHSFVLSQATEDLQGILHSEGSVLDIFQKMIATHLDYAVEEKEIFNLIMEPKQYFDEDQLVHVLNLRKRYEHLFEEIILRGVKSGEFTVKEPSIAKLMILGAMNWVQQWYKPGGRLTKEQLATLYCEYIIKILR